MDSGKRVKQYNFCPTNHETINLLKKQAAVIFREAAAIAASADAAPDAEGRIYHLWPDRGAERTWCSCPACRAFSPEEGEEEIPRCDGSPAFLVRSSSSYASSYIKNTKN